MNLAKLAHVLQLPITQLDVRKPDELGIEAQNPPDVFLGSDTAIVPHDKVVSLSVSCLIDGDGAWEAELAPVGDGPDDAAGGEYFFAC